MNKKLIFSAFLLLLFGSLSSYAKDVKPKNYSEKECLNLTTEDAEHSDVIKRVTKLKTVAQFNGLIKKNNLLEENKTNKVFITFEIREAKYVSNKCFWYIFAIEHHPMHSFLWKSFLVDIGSYDIYEEDQADDSYHIIN